MHLLAIVFLAGLSSSAAAQSAPPGALACTGCHAPGGEGAVPLNSLSAEEIETALAEYREGAREATVMDRIARGFTPDESRAIARWIAGHQQEE